MRQILNLYSTERWQIPTHWIYMVLTWAAVTLKWTAYSSWLSCVQHILGTHWGRAAFLTKLVALHFTPVSRSVTRSVVVSNNQTYFIIWFPWYTYGSIIEMTMTIWFTCSFEAPSPHRWSWIWRSKAHRATESHPCTWTTIQVRNF